MAKSPLPKGAGPGTDNSLEANPIRAKIRRVFNARDIRLPDPGQKAGVSAMKRLMGGKSMSKGSR